MPWVKGLNFRATSGYVTDAADDTYLLNDGSANGENYPVTRNGVTFGYTTLINLSERNRNSGNNPKLAGFHTPDVEASEIIVRIDLPASGDYDMRIAMGEANYAKTGQKVIIRDNGSGVHTVTGSTSGANNFLDMTGTNRTHNAWVSSNAAQTATFASTVAEVVIGDGTGSTGIAHVSFEQLEAAAPAAQPLIVTSAAMRWA